jgi:hypothetical protein
MHVFLKQDLTIGQRWREHHVSYRNSRSQDELDEYESGSSVHVRPFGSDDQMAGRHGREKRCQDYSCSEGVGHVADHGRIEQSFRQRLAARGISFIGRRDESTRYFEACVAGIGEQGFQHAEGIDC